MTRPAYRIELTRRAERDLLTIPATGLRRVISKIDALALDPQPPGCKKLSDDDIYRVRAGDYRILYQIRDRRLLVLVIAVGHRRDVYRRER